MTDLLSHLKKRYGQEDVVRHMEIFNSFALPTPNEGEWLEGQGCDITLINQYSLVFKTLPKSGYKQHMSFGRNPFVLQAIKQLEFNNSCLFILPGVSLTPLTHSEVNPVRFLDSRLAEEEIKTEDIREENIGYLPPTDGYSMPVLVDHGCATGKSEPFRFSKCNVDYTKYQKNAFGYIRAQIHLSWAGRLPSSSQKFQDFLSFCKKQAELDPHETGKSLHNGWMELPDSGRDTSKPLRAKRVASVYHKRIRNVS